MGSAHEIVAIVDEKNTVVGAVARHEMRARRLLHRATYIMVFNQAGELFVQKRTTTKDIYPGYYDIAAGGVVLAGESYEDSAQRELAEEMGIKGQPLTALFDLYYEDESNRVWGRAFTCVYDGPIRLQAEEVESGKFLSLDQIRAMVRAAPFTPDGLVLLARYEKGKG